MTMDTPKLFSGSNILMTILIYQVCCRRLHIIIYGVDVRGFLGCSPFTSLNHSHLGM